MCCGCDEFTVVSSVCVLCILWARGCIQYKCVVYIVTSKLCGQQCVYVVYIVGKRVYTVCFVYIVTSILCGQQCVYMLCILWAGERLMCLAKHVLANTQPPIPHLSSDRSCLRPDLEFQPCLSSCLVSHLRLCFDILSQDCNVGGWAM